MSWFRPLLLGCCALSLGARPVVAAEADESRAPGQPVQLLNGRDLTGWYVYLKDSGNRDPDDVFTVQDGVLHISGAHDGYLATRASFRDYHLVAEYRWGKNTYGPNAKFVRNSGILLHGVGVDGTGDGTWLTSIECQLAQGCLGDLIVIRGQDAQGKIIPATLTSEIIVAADGNTRWKRGGQKRSYEGKQFWWSLHEPGFEELIDTRGKDDVENALGQWNRVECVCDGAKITVIVNGTTINEALDCFPAAGKIALESEGFELYVRKFEIRPLERTGVK